LYNKLKINDMKNFEEFKKKVEESKEAVFGEIDRLISEMEESGDVEKYYEKGVKSAASRLRKGLQSIRKAVHHPTTRTHMVAITDAAKDLREELSK
jgi:methionine synthase II (cobalamin-independent)